MQDMINDVVEVKVDHELHALTVKFLDFIPGDNMIKIFEYEFQLITHYNLQKCFIDLRLLPAYGKGTKEYVRDVWFPKAKSLGVQNVAIVVPEAVLANIVMKEAHKEAEFYKPIEVRHFTHSEEAIEWLRGCEVE